MAHLFHRNCSFFLDKCAGKQEVKYRSFKVQIIVWSLCRECLGFEEDVGTKQWEDFDCTHGDYGKCSECGTTLPQVNMPLEITEIKLSDLS